MVVLGLVGLGPLNMGGEVTLEGGFRQTRRSSTWQIQTPRIITPVSRRTLGHDCVLEGKGCN
jgi:hypothetical protein